MTAARTVRTALIQTTGITPLEDQNKHNVALGVVRGGRRLQLP